MEERPLMLTLMSVGGDDVDGGEEKETSVIKKQHILYLIYGKLYVNVQ